MGKPRVITWEEIKGKQGSGGGWQGEHGIK